ncbi:MAG: hypothetical protein QME66_10580 [Candidatus Eisenbacteria bacterium]|nr:hypothetical protein [Candidatus Eisenbacteria bacterium]
MRTISFFLAFVALLVVCAAPLIAGDAATTRLPVARTLGMGGAYLAIANDHNALYSNPAGLSRVRGMSISIPSISFHTNQDLIDISQDVTDFIDEHESEFADFDSVTDDFLRGLDPFDDRWMSFAVDPLVDLVFPHFGLGAYSTIDARFKIDRGIYQPRISVQVKNDMVGVVGISKSLGLLGKKMDIGVSAKYIQRRLLSESLSGTDASTFDEESIQDMLDTLETAKTGLTFDIGALYPLNGATTLALVLKDVAGKVDDETIPMTVNVGIASRPAILKIIPLFRNTVIAADVDDIFGEGSMLNRVHLGAETKFALLPFITLRGGFNQGYPTYGLGLNLLIVRLDFAYYGEELGSKPGQIPQWNYFGTIKIGF